MATNTTRCSTPIGRKTSGPTSSGASDSGESPLRTPIRRQRLTRIRPLIRHTVPLPSCSKVDALYRPVHMTVAIEGSTSLRNHDLLFLTLRLGYIPPFPNETL